MLLYDLPYVAPIEAAKKLRSAKGFAFLDSTGDDLNTGRYSFIGIDPFGEFVAQDGAAFWNGEKQSGPILARFGEIVANFQQDLHCDGPVFQAGCIGHIAYDFGRLLERLDQPTKTAPICSDMRFGFYDLVIAFDRQKQQSWICSSGLPEKHEGKRAARAEQRLNYALNLLNSPEPVLEANQSVTEWTSNFDASGFQMGVEKVKEYIRDGDIYQANLTQRLQADLPDDYDPWTFYNKLRTANPAPFSAFLSDGSITIASSSPERFISLRNGDVEARPIKGTSPRSTDPLEDKALAAALEASEKDRAENVMIVDLLRNDISRVCVPGTVDVPVICGVETYASVHHLTSIVKGKMRDGLGPVDLIEACFPGGSITGAPKLRAMDIITELEKYARGIYCGSIGYIGFDGSMDLNIAIRTAVLGDNRAVVQAGGGITHLSDAVAEYDEMLTKADRLIAAFAMDG